MASRSLDASYGPVMSSGVDHCRETRCSSRWPGNDLHKPIGTTFAPFIRPVDTGRKIGRNNGAVGGIKTGIRLGPVLGWGSPDAQIGGRQRRWGVVDVR